MTTEKFLEEMAEVQKSALRVLSKHNVEKILVATGKDKESEPTAVFFLCRNQHTAPMYYRAIQETGWVIDDCMTNHADVEDDDDEDEDES